jgi:CRISPR-associated endonuclease Cas2
MAKKKQQPLSFLEKMDRIRKAGLRVEDSSTDPSFPVNDPLIPLSERVEQILHFLKQAQRSTQPEENMYCFIMYDITDNKIRNYIAKYLLEKGCQRVQKSVYLAQLSRRLYDEIVQTLKEVNDLYDNDDSIFFVPIGENYLQEMNMVGRNVDFTLVVDPPTTLFI